MIHNIGDIIFVLVWFGALIFGIALMANGWGLMTNQDEINPNRKWKESRRDGQDANLDKMVDESTHPEMKDIKEGEELMVVRFSEPNEPNPDPSRFKLDSPVLHENETDPLYKSLQDRIQTLRDEVDTEDDDEDDDDDDGGDVVALSR